MTMSLKSHGSQSIVDNSLDGYPQYPYQQQQQQQQYGNNDDDGRRPKTTASTTINAMMMAMGGGGGVGTGVGGGIISHNAESRSTVKGSGGGSGSDVGGAVALARARRAYAEKLAHAAMRDKHIQNQVMGSDGSLV